MESSQNAELSEDHYGPILLVLRLQNNSYLRLLSANNNRCLQLVGNYGTCKRNELMSLNDRLLKQT